MNLAFRHTRMAPNRKSDVPHTSLLAPRQPCTFAQFPTMGVVRGFAAAVILMLTACSLPTRDDVVARMTGTQDPPTGWLRFESEGVTGVARGGWVMDWVDSMEGIDVDEVDSLKAEDVPRADAIGETVPSLAFQVVLERGEGYSTYLTLDGCEQLPPQQATGKAQAAGLMRTFPSIRSVVFDTATYDGRPVDIIRSTWPPRSDVYQALLPTGDCYAALTLLTPPGSSPPLDDLKTFLKYLKISVPLR